MLIFDFPSHEMAIFNHLLTNTAQTDKALREADLTVEDFTTRASKALFHQLWPELFRIHLHSGNAEHLRHHTLVALRGQIHRSITSEDIDRLKASPAMALADAIARVKQPKTPKLPLPPGFTMPGLCPPPLANPTLSESAPAQAAFSSPPALRGGEDQRRGGATNDTTLSQNASAPSDPTGRFEPAAQPALSSPPALCEAEDQRKGGTTNDTTLSRNASTPSDPASRFEPAAQPALSSPPALRGGGDRRRGGTTDDTTPSRNAPDSSDPTGRFEPAAQPAPSSPPALRGGEDQRRGGATDDTTPSRNAPTPSDPTGRFEPAAQPALSSPPALRGGEDRGNKELESKSSSPSSSPKQKKPRRDDRLGNLPEEDQEQILSWVQDVGLRPTVKIIAKPRPEGLGLKVHCTSLRNFYRKQTRPNFELDPEQLAAIPDISKDPVFAEICHKLEEEILVGLDCAEGRNETLRLLSIYHRYRSLQLKAAGRRDRSRFRPQPQRFPEPVTEPTPPEPEPSLNPGEQGFCSTEQLFGGGGFQSPTVPAVPPAEAANSVPFMPSHVSSAVTLVKEEASATEGDSAPSSPGQHFPSPEQHCIPSTSVPVPGHPNNARVQPLRPLTSAVALALKPSRALPLRPLNK